ncbi:MAG: acyltransferase [Longimicrobiales bacterium]
MRPLLASLRGSLSLALFSLNTILWTVPLLISHLLKLLLGVPAWRAFWSRIQNGIGTVWISCNNLNLRVLNPVRWDVRGVEGLPPREWYLVVANHQSWVDILVLQRVFNRKIPFLKFFLKKELFWVPFLGVAWWSLDFPFLERSTRADRDLETIRKAAAKFKVLPVSIMNFVEGTRFTPEKHERQRSPYRHLLKPKAGGLTFILSAMGQRLHAILDVTIAYPGGTPTFWRFLCGEVREVRVRVKPVPVEEALLGDYSGDKAFRREFSAWLSRMWAEKDAEMDGLLGASPDGGGPGDPGAAGPSSGTK